MNQQSITWSAVEEDFFIASVGDSVVGYVRESSQGSNHPSFSAFDTDSKSLGQFGSFEEAAEAVTNNE